MKIIFLDIDGVLNSYAYDRQRSAGDGNIDKTRLVLLRSIVDQTDAKIVLTSSWRVHWDRDPAARDGIGASLAADFASAGLDIYGKTPKKGYLERSDEIRAWLCENGGVDAFVILDDNCYGWGDLSDNFVQTNYRVGRGLEDSHVRVAIDILNGKEISDV